MSSIRRIILVGLVAADPGSTKSIRGRTKVIFAVGVARKYTFGGVTKAVTDFYRVVSRGRRAEFCAKLREGQGIYVEGTLVDRAFEQGGERTYIPEIHVSDVAMVYGLKERVETLSLGSHQAD